MVFRMELTYNGFEKKHNVKCIPTLYTRYTLPTGTYEISDNNSMLKSLFPDEVKVYIAFDDIRKKSNLTNNKIFRFTKNRFFYIIRIYPVSFRSPRRYR